MHTPPAHVLPYLPLCPTLRSLTQGHLPICQVHNPYLLAYPNYHNLLFCSIADDHAFHIVGDGEANRTSFTQVISSPLCSQFLCQPLIYQCHHQSIILLCLILSLPLHLSRFVDDEEDWFGARETRCGVYDLVPDNLLVWHFCLLSSSNSAL